MNTILILVTINVVVWVSLAWCAAFQGSGHRGSGHSTDGRGTLDRKASTIGDGS